MPVLRLLGDLTHALSRAPAGDFDPVASRKLLDCLILLAREDGWTIDENAAWSGGAAYYVIENERVTRRGIFTVGSCGGPVTPGRSIESVARHLFERIADLEREHELYVDGLLCGDGRWNMSWRYPMPDE